MSYDGLRAGTSTRGRAGRTRAAVRAAPLGADRLLLSDARVAVRGRGRGPGHVPPGLAGVRPVRGPRSAPVVAVPDRDQRLPRHAERPQPPRATDGLRP